MHLSEALARSCAIVSREGFVAPAAHGPVALPRVAAEDRRRPWTARQSWQGDDQTLAPQQLATDGVGAQLHTGPRRIGGPFSRPASPAPPAPNPRRTPVSPRDNSRHL